MSDIIGTYSPLVKVRISEGVNRVHIERLRPIGIDFSQENYQWDGKAWPFSTMAVQSLLTRPDEQLFEIIG